MEERLEGRLEEMGRLLSARFILAESRADFRRACDDGLAHDAGSPAADDSHRPAVHRRQSAMLPVRPWTPHPTIFDGAIKDTLEKAEAVEKHVKTMTMRPQSLATTKVDFFETLLVCQEEAPRHLNELSAQLGQQNTTYRPTVQSEWRRKKKVTSTCVTESPSDGCCDDGPGLFPQPFMYLGHLWRWPARLEIGGSGAPAKGVAEQQSIF